jgi:hypothetical protein
MIVLTWFMLAPGACAGYFAATSLRAMSASDVSMLAPLGLLCLLVAGGGAAPMIWGFRRPGHRRGGNS